MKTKFEELTGMGDFVPMSELFEIAYNEIYDEDKTSDMVSCHLLKDSVDFIVTDDCNQYVLCVLSDWRIYFTCNGTSLHFNQYPLYAKLYEWGFLTPAKDGMKEGG